jgi:hypothetical protein
MSTSTDLTSVGAKAGLIHFINANIELTKENAELRVQLTQLANCKSKYDFDFTGLDGPQKEFIESFIKTITIAQCVLRPIGPKAVRTFRAILVKLINVTDVIESDVNFANTSHVILLFAAIDLSSMTAMFTAAMDVLLRLHSRITDLQLALSLVIAKTALQLVRG